jgi:hypothetical protein
MSLDEILERVRQLNTARARDLAESARRGTPLSLVSAGTVRAGTRVFDLVSGHEGVTENGVLQYVSNAPLISVRLTSGALILRPPADLVVRPDLPTAPARP